MPDIFDHIKPDQTDVFDAAHAHATAAVATFLPPKPSLMPPPQPQAPAPVPVASAAVLEALRALGMAARVEKMSARMARGLPAVEPAPAAPPSPLEQFGNELMPVHMQAISHAIADAPETKRGALLAAVHEQVHRWIDAHNGKVVVDGKVQLARNPDDGERLAQRIVNEAMAAHDQREGDKKEQAVAAQPVAGNAAQPQPQSPPVAMTQSTGANDAAPAPATAGTAPSAITPAGQQPEIVPPHDEPIVGKPPAVAPDDVRDIGEKDDESGRDIVQPTDSKTDNSKLALDAAPELNDLLAKVSASVPGAKFARLRPQKSQDRLEDKSDDGKPPETISDYLAAQIAADSPAAKDALLAVLKKTGRVVDVDDSFTKGRSDKAGYPSANLQLQMSNGGTAELQIVPREVQEATDRSHHFYKLGRDAETAGDSAARDQHWQKAESINRDALDRFNARNAAPVDHGQMAHDALTAAGLRVAGKPISLGGKLFIALHPPTVAAPAADPTSSFPPSNEGEKQEVTPGEQDTPAPEAASAAPDSSASAMPEAVPEAAPMAAAADRSPESAAPRQWAKGDRVTLKDGRKGQVQYVHPEMDIVRLKINGKTKTMNLKELG